MQQIGWRWILDCAMGDFDSVSTKIYQKYHQMQTAFVSYPIRKRCDRHADRTEWAVEQGAEEIHILGATGKRLDHFLGNVNILMIPLQKGIGRILLIRITDCI